MGGVGNIYNREYKYSISEGDFVNLRVIIGYNNLLFVGFFLM